MIIWFWEISKTTGPGGRVIHPEALGKTVWKDLIIFENVVWKRFLIILFWKQFSKINECFILQIILKNNLKMFFEYFLENIFGNRFWKTFLKTFLKAFFLKIFNYFLKTFLKTFFENFLRTDCFNNYNINFATVVFLKNVFEICFGKRFWKSF